MAQSITRAPLSSDRTALQSWPYAVRRYNGAGVNSYHYQAQVLLRVLNG
jgi:hypothetical protein